MIAEISWNVDHVRKLSIRQKFILYLNYKLYKGHKNTVMYNIFIFIRVKIKQIIPCKIYYLK